MLIQDNKISTFYKAKRVAICLQYDGSRFCGWQKQNNALGVQEVLEKKIALLDPISPIKTFAAGRTDSGVHAAGQVVHFDSIGPIPACRWMAALNGCLPNSIRVSESILVPKDWHACYSALYRRYRYTIYNGRNPNLFLAPWSWHKYHFKLDEKIMMNGLQQIIGRHDFSAFLKTGSKRKDAFTEVQDVKIERKGDLIIIEIQASGFLYGMVRLLVGQLVLLGEHKITLERFERSLRNRLRSEVKEGAPAHGLCFIRAGYKENFFQNHSHDYFPCFSLNSYNPPPAPIKNP
tara:strand:- start:164 stop:1036 length:873 start_codon:yes stop_codon:yes gene_type:complete